MIKTKYIMAVTLFLMTGLAQAATITKSFEAVVQTVTNSAEIGVAVGNVFQGGFTYDDTLATQNGNFIVDAPDIIFNFRGITGPIHSESATLSPNGALVNLDFSIDIGNQFFFSTDLVNPLKFHFEFSKLVPTGMVDPDTGEPLFEQVTTGSGLGIIREPGVIQQTPVPAAVWLFLSGLGLLARRRRIV